jgi:hypothetical protein
MHARQPDRPDTAVTPDDRSRVRTAELRVAPSRDPLDRLDCDVLVDDERSARERAELEMSQLTCFELGDLENGGGVPLARSRNPRNAGLDPAERARISYLVEAQETCGSIRP